MPNATEEIKYGRLSVTRNFVLVVLSNWLATHR